MWAVRTEFSSVNVIKVLIWRDDHTIKRTKTKSRKYYHFYRPQGKLMFSEACVSHSVYRRICLLGDLPTRGSAHWGVCLLWVCLLGGSPYWRSTSWRPPSNDIYWLLTGSGKYASYWNAFLFFSNISARSTDYTRFPHLTSPGFLLPKRTKLFLENLT